MKASIIAEEEDILFVSKLAWQSFTSSSTAHAKTYTAKCFASCLCCTFNIAPLFRVGSTPHIQKLLPLTDSAENLLFDTKCLAYPSQESGVLKCSTKV